MQSHIPTLLPIAEPTESAWNLILVDTAIHCPMLGLAAPAIARPLQRGYQLKLLDGHAIADEPPQNLPPTVLQLFIRANPFRSTAGIIHQAQVWLKALTSAKTLRGVALYGSPYVLEILRPLVPDEIPWVFSYGQMPQAQAIALEALFGGDVGKWKSDRTFTD
jgi:beta-glucosidase